MTHKNKESGCIEKRAYYANELRWNVGLETGLWRQIVTSQTAHNKYKCLPYATEWNPSPWKFSAYATGRVRYKKVVYFNRTYSSKLMRSHIGSYKGHTSRFSRVLQARIVNSG